MTKPCKVEQSPRKLILIQGQLGFSPAVLKKVILSTVRLLQQDGSEGLQS